MTAMAAERRAAGAWLGSCLGDYELVALLAMGGTSAIYLARIAGVAGFEKYVVVKCLHEHLADDATFVQMFLDEARLGAALAHSNIAQIIGLGEHEGRYYMVMEHVVGLSLAQMARHASGRTADGRLPIWATLGVAIQACAGLHYAHDLLSGDQPLNVIHRDVSPPNLVVTFDGLVKVVDFGIAKADRRATSTQGGLIKGKFAYMAPEQCLALELDRRADVFALGVVVHELLVGRRLFKRATPYETYQAIVACEVAPPSVVQRGLDPGLDSVVMTALARDPERRYPTAEAFAEAMAAYLHRRGEAAGVGELARFMMATFGPELEASGAQMRELLAGRTRVAPAWDDADRSVPVRTAAADHLTPISDETSREAVASVDGQAAALDEDGDAEATRVELHPTRQLAELDAVVRARALEAAGPDVATVVAVTSGSGMVIGPDAATARIDSGAVARGSVAMAAVVVPAEELPPISMAPTVVIDAPLAHEPTVERALVDLALLGIDASSAPAPWAAAPLAIPAGAWQRWGPWIALSVVSAILMVLVGVIAALHR